VSRVEPCPIAIQPVVNYPREAEVGQKYLMTVDLCPALAGSDWPYVDEEYAVYCILDTEPLFSYEPLGEPAVVLHRFGGTYGSVKFLLTAKQLGTKGSIRVTLVNGWGIPLYSLNLSDIQVVQEVTHPLGKITTVKRPVTVPPVEGDAQIAMALTSSRVLPLEEVTVQLILENRGSGPASGVVANIQPSQDYRVSGGGRIEVGSLPVGSTRKLDFKIGPGSEREVLRLVFQITYRDRRGREKIEVFADRVYLREELATFTKIASPYIAGVPLGEGSSLFFGREDICRLIYQRLSTPATTRPILLLTHVRRMGVTSLLRQLPERLEHLPYIPVFIDCQRILGRGMSEFLWRFCDSISEGLAAAGLSVEALSPVDLKDEPEFVFENRFLPKVWECIGDRSLLLVIDELGALYERVQREQLPPEVYAYLRSLIQSQEKMTFILAGEPDTLEQISSYEPAFLDLVESMHFSFLAREDAIQLITEPVRSYDMLYDDLAVEEILRLTACHPYFLQLVCDVVVDHCNERECNYVTIQDVRDVSDRIMEQGSAQLKWIWMRSSSAEKAVLSALVSLLHSQERTTAPNVVEHLNDRIGSLADVMSFDLLAVTQALEGLLAREVIQVEETPGEPTHYTFTAHLYYKWISKHRPLDRIGPELVEETI